MKLKRVHIISTNSCDGLLKGLDVRFPDRSSDFDPICLVGPNGSGKSQFLQATAEIFQSILHHLDQGAERDELNQTCQFEVEYSVYCKKQKKVMDVFVGRKMKGRSLTWDFKINSKGHYEIISGEYLVEFQLYPSAIIGYTSGGNETLSAPFYVSRAAYAEAVRQAAFDNKYMTKEVQDGRLIYIDHDTHQEAFVANLLGNSISQLRPFLKLTNFADLLSFRIIVQLAHGAAPGARSKNSKRKGVQLTMELEAVLDYLQSCSTCYLYEEETESYTFDFLVSDATREGIDLYWQGGANDVFSTFHKLSMLNDLILKRASRNKYLSNIKNGSYAAKLPRPSEDDFVFRIEGIKLKSKQKKLSGDYIALSDGEHQRAQIFSMFNILRGENILFLLDEPESHFNPKWRVEFIRALRELMPKKKIYQDCILTTHSPFVPSDMKKENVFVFRKDKGILKVTHPENQTYGARFDRILEDCFEINPPISTAAFNEIDKLMKSGSAKEIEVALEYIANSVERAHLIHRLTKLKSEVVN